MGFIARVSSLAVIVLLGGAALGCGQVAQPQGEDGTGGFGGARVVTRGDSELPSSTDRFAFAKSGDRLDALGYISDGVAQFRTFHDQQLGVDCEFVNGKVCGDLRCVPKRTAQLIFLDASCSQPATWVLFEEVQVGDWVSIGPAISPCSGQAVQRESFEIGEEVYPESLSGPPQPVFELRGTNCVTAYPPAKSIPAVNRLIPHSDRELVAAEPVRFDVGGGLYLSRLLGEDGSELTVGVTTAAGVACSIQASGECIPLDKNATVPFPMTQRIRQGSGAAHIDLFTSSTADGHAGVPIALFPEALDFMDNAGDRCRVVSAVDGTLRCAVLSPEALQIGNWADAACTERLYYDAPSSVDPSALRVGLYGGRASDQLVAVSTVRVYDGPIYTSLDGICTVQTEPGLDAVLLTLDRRTEASAMPLVFETTL